MPLRTFDDHPGWVAIIYLIVLPILALAAGIYLFVVQINTNVRTHRLAVDGQQAHAALCAFRADLKQRRDSTDAYLATHKGDLVLGTIRIPRSQLIAQADGQTATLDALTGLDCKETK